MAFNAELLLERAKLRAKIRRWRLLALLLVVGLVIVAAGQGVAPGGMPTHKDYIARIEIKGFIDTDREILESIEKITANDRIKAVLLEVDSPGGSAVGGEVYYDALKRLQQKKPVVALFGNLATSAAYLISTPAERIYAYKASITGSIGALVQFPNVKELSDKVGVKMQTVKTGSLKGEPTPFDEMTPEAQAMLHGMVQDFYGVFVEAIATHRNIPVEQVLAIADGRVLTGQQAIRHKLVDAIGGEKEAVTWLEEQQKVGKGLEVIEVKLKAPKDPFEKLLMGTSVRELLLPEAFFVNGLLSIWHNGAIF